MNKSKQSILADLMHYKETYPSEREMLQGYLSFVNRTGQEDLYRRSNFDGHITGSAFIVDEAMESILLLHHKTLELWLQPGGHIDLEDDSILSGALREVEEETGILSSEIQLISSSQGLALFDIDSHPIAANAKKCEDAHVHHDARYLLKINQARHIEIREDESYGFQWVKLVDLVDDKVMGRVAKKILKVAR